MKIFSPLEDLETFIFILFWGYFGSTHTYRTILVFNHALKWALGKEI